MKTRVLKKIEKALDAEQWIAARKLIEEELKRDPKDHWYLGQLAST
jgi:hypothetical protein